MEIPLDGRSVTSFPSKRIKHSRRGNEKCIRSFAPYTDPCCCWLVYITLTCISLLVSTLARNSVLSRVCFRCSSVLVPRPKRSRNTVVHVVNTKRQVQLSVSELNQAGNRCGMKTFWKWRNSSRFLDLGIAWRSVVGFLDESDAGTHCVRAWIGL